MKQETVEFQPGQLGQGANLTQSGIGSFGVEDSHTLRMGQDRNTGTSSHFDSRIGATQSLIGQRAEGKSESYIPSNPQPSIQPHYAQGGTGGSSLGGSNIGGNLQQLFSSRG